MNTIMNNPPSWDSESGSKENSAGISPAQMRELIRHWYEDILSGPIAEADNTASADWKDTDINLSHLFTPDFTNHHVSPSFWKLKHGIPAALQIVQNYRLACPDLTIKIEDMLVSGDKVTTRYTAECTHTASPFFNMPPTGRHYKISGIVINRIENGKIAESWGIWDIYSLMQQMGILPPSLQPKP